MTKINRRKPRPWCHPLSTRRLSLRHSCSGQDLGPTEGKEIFPGVRLVTLGTRDSHIKGYKTIFMEDIVYQPKGSIPLGDVMADDMVCTVIRRTADQGGDMDSPPRKATCGGAQG